jgi:hypothetical protein
MSVEVQAVPLKAVLEKLEAEKGIWHKGDDNVLKEEISISFENLPLDLALKRLLSRFDYVLVFGEANELAGVIIVGETYAGITYSRNASKNLEQTFRLGNSEKTTPKAINPFQSFLEEPSSVNRQGKRKTPFSENPFARGTNDRFADPFPDSSFTDNPFKDLPNQETLNPFTRDDLSTGHNPFDVTPSLSVQNPFEAGTNPASGSE